MALGEEFGHLSAYSQTDALVRLLQISISQSLLGDFWHEADIPVAPIDVRFRG